MKLTVDIGNTTIDFGILSGNKLKYHFKLPSKKGKVFYKLYLKKYLNKFEIEKILISSVVPSMNEKIGKVFVEIFKKEPHFIDKPPGINIKYKKGELGIDRILDVIGALRIFKPPLLVVDFGTATTFNCVDENGDFVGGAIVPGPDVFSHSLPHKAEKIKPVKITWTEKKIGKTTKENLMVGIFWGYVFLIRGLIKMLRKCLGKRVRVIATGDAIGPYKEHIPEISNYVPHLTLIGLGSIE